LAEAAVSVAAFRAAGGALAVAALRETGDE
jgi:hypothetical protein